MEAGQPFAKAAVVGVHVLHVNRAAAVAAVPMDPLFLAGRAAWRRRAFFLDRLAYPVQAGRWAQDIQQLLALAFAQVSYALEQFPEA